MFHLVTDDVPSSPSPVQSPSQHENINSNTIILASSITTGLLLLLVILFVVITSIVCAAVAMRQKRHNDKGILMNTVFHFYQFPLHEVQMLLIMSQLMIILLTSQ